MNRRVRSRPLLWLALALPGLYICWRWLGTPQDFGQDYGYGHAIADSGDWAAWLLMAALAATPLRLILKNRKWTLWLLRHRRDLGVASFAYAMGHTAIYLMRKADVSFILKEASTPYMLAGWAALAVFLPLAATSNDYSTRRLKRAWKQLHRLVYPAALLAFLHWALSAYDPLIAYLHIAILAALELTRIALQQRQRVT